MCGIAGILRWANNTPVEPAAVGHMLASIRHRGPDAAGIYTFRDGSCSIGLGNTRLSIIDIEGGDQPISNEENTLWIVFNGEVFNYIELRRELTAKGHHFTTSSDTEVIVHAFEEFGPNCVRRLNGQFAFAIWDENKHRLFLARDRLGIRPLYYNIQSDVLTFGSEIKAVLGNPDVPCKLDLTTLDQIFTYWSALAPRSIFENIRSLPPGHWLLIEPGNRPRLRQYWRLEFPLEGDFASAGRVDRESLDECAAELNKLLLDATRVRLRADVDVGAYISGGLDSSAIATMIDASGKSHLETFSIAFCDSRFDERKYQEVAARRLGRDHHVITCTNQEIGQAFPDVIWHTETPVLRTSPAPMYLLSRLAHDHGLKVILTGEGADEFLAGYNIFKEMKIRRYWAKEPGSPRRAALLDALYPYVDDLGTGSAAYRQRFFGTHLLETENPYYSHLLRWRNSLRLKRFYSQDLKALLAGDEVPWEAEVPLPAEFMQWSPLARAQYLEISIFLSEYLLSMQGDRVAMAHSVEGRFPFLDHRIVEFCNKLPARFKLFALDEKHLLKRAMRSQLPDEIVKRPKRPYRAPIHRSFFVGGKPLDWVADLLSPDQVRGFGYFDPEAISRLVKKIERFGALGETDDMALTGILSTQLVHQQYLSGFRPWQDFRIDKRTKLVARTDQSQRVSSQPRRVASLMP